MADITAADRPRSASRLQAIERAFRIFLAIPTLIVLGMVGLAFLTLALDRLQLQVLGPERTFLTTYMFGDPNSTAGLLSTVAGAVVTIASITFSVILIALQQSASTMSSQVFDQFLRRRRNQVFFGFFLGVGMYALFTLGTVTPDFNPAVGALVTLILAGIALALIPVVIYATIDEMRPQAIISTIRDHAADGYEVHQKRIARTLRRVTASGPGQPIRSTRTGFVADLDLERLTEVLGRLGASAQLEVHARVGDFVAFDDLLATVHGIEVDAFTPRKVESLITIQSARDVSIDPRFAIDQLEAIAWTSSTSSKQNPEPAMLVVRYLSDLVNRWATSASGDAGSGADRAPVVYRDDVLRQAVLTIGSIAVGASEGMQHQTATAVYRSFASIYPHLGPEDRKHAEETIIRTLTGLADHILTLNLDEALTELAVVLQLEGAGDVAGRVEAARDQLREGVGKLSARGVRPAQAAARVRRGPMSGRSA